MVALSRKSHVAETPVKRAVLRVLSGGKDPLFDRLAMHELPARAVHKVRNFGDSVDEIERKASRETLKTNVSALLSNPLKFLLTKNDNETISKSAIAVLAGVNALAATLSVYVYGAAPTLFLDTLKVWAMANVIASVFILTRKNVSRFREIAEPEIDELARSTIAMVRE